MKTALSAIAAAILSGLAFAACGYRLDIYDYVLIAFATSILVWTFEQYDHHRQH